MFIEFNGYHNRPISIRSSLIMAVSEHPGSTAEFPQTVLTIANDGATDEWIVRENKQSVLAKLYDANP